MPTFKPMPVRKHPRVPIAMPVQFELDGQFISGSTRNISQGGVFIEASEHLANGDATRVRMQFDDESTPIEVEGEVVWVADIAHTTYGFPPPGKSDKDAPKGMGVRFREMQANSKRALACFVRDLQDLLRIMAIAEKNPG